MSSRSRRHRLLSAAVVTLLLSVWVRAAVAQVATYRGTASCVKSGCHVKEKDWFEKEDGPPPNQHRNGFEQLTRDLDKSKKYAGSLGLTDPQDPAGRCVECHAPPQRTRFRDGVSCEVCHGPGSAYYDVHDDEPYKTNGYPKSLKLGMFPMLDSPNVWAERCMNCHVLQEAKLIAAGHPSGDDFDLGTKYRIVASPNGNHWKANYGPRLDEIRKPAATFGDRIRQLRPKGAPTMTMSTPPPAAVVPIAPPVPMPIPVPPPPVPATVTAAATPPPPASTAASSPAGRPTAASPPPVAASPAAAPRTVPGRSAAPVPTPSVPAAAPPAAMSSVPAAATLAVVPRSPASLVAAVQGRAIELFTTLLQRGGVAPVRVVVLVPSTYVGPDAELLQLQREALQLALAALGTAPAPPPQPKK